MDNNKENSTEASPDGDRLSGNDNPTSRKDPTFGILSVAMLALSIIIFFSGLIDDMDIVFYVTILILLGIAIVVSFIFSILALALREKYWALGIAGIALQASMVISVGAF